MKDVLFLSRVSVIPLCSSKSCRILLLLLYREAKSRGSWLSLFLAEISTLCLSNSYAISMLLHCAVASLIELTLVSVQDYSGVTIAQRLQY